MKKALGILLLAACTSAFPLAFKEKHCYTFDYQTEIIHSIPGGANKQTGLRLQCQCHVTIVKRSDPAEAQIKLENVQLHQLQINQQNQESASQLQADPEAIKLLEKNPIELMFSPSGRVKTVRADKQEPEWCLNIKRGIANMLQIAPKAENMDPKQVLTTKTPIVVQQKEQTVVGNCPVTYTVEPWVKQDAKSKKLSQVTRVTKTLQYDKCVDRPALKESIVLGQLCPSCQKSIGYVPYLRHAGQIEHILDDRFLKEANSEEFHTFTPYSELGGKVEALVRQRMVYQSEKEKQAAEILKNPMETTLAMKIVHPEQEIRQNQQYKQGIKEKVMQLQKQLAQEVAKDLSSHTIPQIVSQLTTHLRMCDKETWQQFLQETVKHSNLQVRQLCADAMALAATTEFNQLVNDMVKNKKTSQVPLQLWNRILTNVVFLPEVTAEHVDAVLNLCQKAPEFQLKEQLAIRRQCYMSYGALVNRLMQRQDAQQSTAIQATLKTCIQHLQNKLQQAQSTDEKLCFVKAMGNAGQPEHQALILKHLQDLQEAMVVRVECVWALRRMVHPDLRDSLISKLIGIFHDRQQDPELRMAIVELIMDKQPTFINMQTFLNAVIRERESQGQRSNQVASWVISKLSSLAYYDNIILKERAARARRCLSSARQDVSKMDFGIQFSKAMRVAMYSNKLLTGFELEMNKMNVPQSYIPRNMNARLLVHIMGRKFEVIQTGARMEGIQQTVEDLASEIRSRQRRSIWSSVWYLFSNQEAKPTAEGSKQRVQPTTQTSADSYQEGEEHNQRPGERTPQRPINSEDQDNPKNQEIDMFMKVFGQEVKFMRITPETIKQVADELTDLLLEKKQQIQTAFGAIKITKNSLTITQSITKAFLAAHARQLEPTFCGMPLHHQVMSTAVAQLETKINAKVEPSLWKILTAKDFKITADVKPKVTAFTISTIQIHTPFVRAGLKSQNVMQMRPRVQFSWEAKNGKSYTFRTETPRQQTDIFVARPDPNNDQAVGVCGIVETQNVATYQVNQQEIPLQISNRYVAEYKEKCYGKEIFGIAACIKARIPSLATLRFSDVPVFPFLSQTNLRVRLVPKDDVQNIEVQVNADKQKQSDGEIVYRVNGKTQREMTVRYSYSAQQNRLKLEVQKISGLPSYLRAEALIDCQSLRSITAVVKQGRFIWTVSSDIDKTGQLVNLKFKWNKLPQSLKRTIRKYEPQILFALQRYASISIQDRPTKSVQITFHLLTAFAAQFFVESPLVKAQTKVMSLPMSMRRMPLSFQEILQWPYGQCGIKSQEQNNQKRISIFDRKSYSFSAPKSSCHHTLLQDKKQKFVEVAVQSQSNGQMDLIVKVKHPQQLTVVLKHDLSVVINGKKSKQDDIRLPGIQITKKRQTFSVTLNSKYYLQITYQPRDVQILASPSLRDQLRGLCGDNNGEDYQELRSPQNKIFTDTDEFAQSWRTQC